MIGALGICLFLAVQPSSPRAAAVTVRVVASPSAGAVDYTIDVTNTTAEDVTDVVVGAKRDLVHGYLTREPLLVEVPDGWFHKLIRQKVPRRSGMTENPRWQLWLSADSNLVTPPEEREQGCASCPGHHDDALATYSIHAGETRAFRVRFARQCPALENGPTLVVFAGAQIVFGPK
jgi:hypothetical protein